MCNWSVAKISVANLALGKLWILALTVAKSMDFATNRGKSMKFAAIRGKVQDLLQVEEEIMKWPYILLAIASGTIMPIQASVNARLSKSLKYPIYSAIVV